MADEPIMDDPHEMNQKDALDGILIDGQPVQRSAVLQVHMPASGPTTGLWCSPFAPGPEPNPPDKPTGGYYIVTER